MTTTFEDAKAGDQLWSVEFGWGEVVSIDVVSKCFTVEFTDDEFETYCLKGARKRPLREKMQTLFWDEIVIDAPAKPMPVLQVDTKVLVWGRDREEKKKRYFSHHGFNGRVICFNGGHTSWFGDKNLEEWASWELAE